MAKQIASGVGARYAEAFLLNSSTGLPNAPANTRQMIGGTLMHIKSFEYNTPDDQEITHYDDDRPYAKDSLPPTEVGSFTIVGSRNDMVVDTLTEGTNIVSIDNVKARLGNSDNRGSEPSLFISTFRQALDTVPTSPTFGKLRQYNMAVVPSTRLINKTMAFAQTTVDKQYQGIPTPVTETPWKETFTEDVWGGLSGEYIEFITDFKPVWNFVNTTAGTLSYQLTKPPVSEAHLHIWLDGTLQSQLSAGSVNTSVSNPAFTLTGDPGAKFMAVLIEHNQPR